MDLCILIIDTEYIKRTTMVQGEKEDYQSINCDTCLAKNLK